MLKKNLSKANSTNLTIGGTFLGILGLLALLVSLFKKRHKARRPIKIIGSNTSTGRLKLDRPCLKAWSGDTVLWIIHPHSGVDSIEGIDEKSGIDDIWLTRPQNHNHWTGVIKQGVEEDYDYEYEIKWKSKVDGRIYTHDPIIRVNPS
jgi:hypothetical protein